jgi:hypothetical protein
VRQEEGRNRPLRQREDELPPRRDEALVEHAGRAGQEWDQRQERRRRENGTNGKNGADGKAGANGKDGANGANGASVGIVDFSDSPFELPLTRQAIATLPSVPPGSYVLLAKAQLENTKPTEGATVHCSLAGDEAVTELAAKGSATISLSSVNVSPLTASISLECFGTGGVKVSFARLIAIQLQTLSGTSS